MELFSLLHQKKWNNSILQTLLKNMGFLDAFYSMQSLFPHGGTKDSPNSVMWDKDTTASGALLLLHRPPHWADPTTPPQITASDSCKPADTLSQPKPNPCMLKTQLWSPGMFLQPKNYRNYWKYYDSKLQLFQQWKPWSAAHMALNSCCGLEPDSSFSSMFHIDVNPPFWDSCPSLCYCKGGQEGLKNCFLGI